MSLSFPPGTLQGYAYLAYDNVGGSNWVAISGPIPASGTSLTVPISAVTPPLTLIGSAGALFAVIENGTPLPTPTPSPVPTPVTTPTPAATPTPIPANGSSLTGPSLSPNGGWGPPAIANALSYPVQSGYDGSGFTIAIVMDNYPLPSDYQAFLSYFQIPTTTRSISTIAVDGGPNGSDTAGYGEIALDTETIAGLAPGANVLIYGVPSLTQLDFNDAVNRIITDKYASIINYSAGGCELASDKASTDPILATAASDGIAVVASAGDQGNECSTGLGGYQPGTVFPASDPNVIGVGGTETYPPPPQAPTLTSTAVWNDYSCGTGQQCAGGGGVSGYFSLPSYQQGLPGAASQTYRNVPDISMPAEGAGVYINGQWQAINGTSWGAPQYAAMLAEIYEYCNASFQDPVTIPYYVDVKDANAFIDVVSGNNQFNGTSPYYTASAGYDNASGFGVPIGTTYANTICPNRVPAFVPRPVAALSTARGISMGNRTLDVTPHVKGLTDLGVRALALPSRIQIVLDPGEATAMSQDQIVQFLQSRGFTITQTFSNYLVIDATGSARSIDTLFHTTLHTVVQGRFGERYLPYSPIAIPSAIAKLVHGVVLDDVVTMSAR